jgi:hypothetical protein
VHGGCIATLVDVIGSAAIVTLADRGGVSVSINTTYLSPAPIGQASEGWGCGWRGGWVGWGRGGGLGAGGHRPGGGGRLRRPGAAGGWCRRLAAEGRASGVAA